MASPIDNARHHHEPSAEDSLRSVMRFARALQHRRNTVAWSVVVALSLATVYYLVAPRYYESTARLQIIYQDADSLSPKNDLRSDDVMATHREIVRAARVVGQAIKNLEPEHLVDLNDAPASKWVEKVTANLTASTVRKTKIIKVGYRSRSADAAAAVVREVINSYLAYVADTHRGTAAKLYEETQSRIAKIEVERAAKQQQLLEIRQLVGDLSTDGPSSVSDPLISQAVYMNDAYVEATQKRVELESSLASLQQAVQRGDDLTQHLSLVEEAVGKQILLSSLGIGEQDLRNLGERQKRLLQLHEERTRVGQFLGPNHPDVLVLSQQIADLELYLATYHANVGKRFSGMQAAQLGPLLTSTLARSVNQARQHERLLQASFEQSRQQAAAHSGRLMQVSSLERELERLDTEHDQLLARRNSIDPQQIQDPIRASIVQEPLPALEPASPKLVSTYLGALVASLVLGCAAVYLQDLLDDRFNTPEEMTQQLGLPVLSIIRKFVPASGDEADPGEAMSGVDSGQGEAFRTLRTALTIGSVSSDRLAVSSAEPGDGKTTVSLNLAVSFAQVGRRTLIIDADLRKPGMTTLLELKGKPGVTDLLTTQGDLATAAEGCVLPTKQEGLDVIPAGPWRPDAAELLSGANFAELLAWADARYDQVLVDCPPVLAVSDAMLVGQLVDGVMLVVSPEKNHRRLVARACDSFLSAGIHMFGVAVNRVSHMVEDGYGYGYGYGEEENQDPHGADGPDDGAEPLRLTPAA